MDMLKSIGALAGAILGGAGKAAPTPVAQSSTQSVVVNVDRGGLLDNPMVVIVGGVLAAVVIMRVTR